MKCNLTILGIDPGTNIMGFGLIKLEGSKIIPILLDELVLKHFSCHYERLAKIYNRTSQIIETYHPDEVALEAPFFGNNVQSMLKLGRAQGVAIAAAAVKGLPITEYAPRKIKMAITGNGNASKEQLASTLIKILNIKEPKGLDATDGLATAVCHAYNHNTRFKQTKSKSNQWASFIAQNPDKIL